MKDYLLPLLVLIAFLCSCRPAALSVETAAPVVTETAVATATASQTLALSQELAKDPTKTPAGTAAPITLTPAPVEDGGRWLVDWEVHELDSSTPLRLRSGPVGMTRSTKMLLDRLEKKGGGAAKPLPPPFFSL